MMIRTDIPWIKDRLIVCPDYQRCGIGAPTMMKAMGLNISAIFAFIMSFYVFLVGSKVLLSIIVGKSKSFLSGTVYIYTMRFLGFVLGVLALVLFHDGLKLLGIIKV